ncbi:MAG: hypothetical protein ACI8TQ_003942, partial [Planctomycetota bacterium]
SQADAIQNSGVSPKGTAGSTETKAQGAVFKALLEKLDAKARTLEEQTLGVDDAKDLAGAVEGAKASLAEALSLGEELLESYRQIRQQNDGPAQSETK